jgi:hypothetical protein
MFRKILAGAGCLTFSVGLLGLAPAFGANSASAANYIVVFKDGTSSATQDADFKRVGAKAKVKFKSILSGATAQLTPSQAKLLLSLIHI